MSLSSIMTATTTSVCNHCDEDHHHQPQARKRDLQGVVVTRVTSDEQVAQKAWRKKRAATRLSSSTRSFCVQGPVQEDDARKRLQGVDYSCEVQGRRAEKISHSASGCASPSQATEKCIICRSNCKDINECRRSGTAIHVRCQGERGVGGVTAAATATEYQQRPVSSVTVEDEVEVGQVKGRGFGFDTMSSPDRSRRRSLSFFDDWGGVERMSACADVTVKGSGSEMVHKEHRKRKSGGALRMKRALNGLSASIFVLFVTLLLTTPTTPPSSLRGRGGWGGLLMGPGALMVGANVIVLDGNSTMSPETGVCQSIDVRNTPAELTKLKNCRVIEGFLQIVLMDNITVGSFDNYTFPLLTEITDFFMFVRVTGLRSIGAMFPNLAVIRGSALFENYAFIVFELPNLENVGLHSLAVIERGGVRLEDNTNLCFSETTDWGVVVNSTASTLNKFQRNRKENECAVCPDQIGGRSCFQLQYPKKRHACWNLDHCQVICPAQCRRNCDKMGNCCDKSCLGGCSVGNPTNCTACRHFSLGDRPSRKCVDECPQDYFRHKGRRCITKTECLSITKPIYSPFTMPQKPYIPFMGDCRLDCPETHQLDEDNRTCKPCPKGLCKKTCVGAKIDSIAAAQKMMDCQIITGTLEVQIRREGGYSVVSELERNLFKIEEIEGHLKISRSDPLVSLGFLKNLKLIRGLNAEGKPKGSTEPSLTLSENDNLQNLFNENQTVQIWAGALNIHTNPKLCVNRIEMLRPMLSKNIKFDLEKFRSSNGDRVACNLTELAPKVDMLYEKMAFITIDPLKEYTDLRSLLGYVIHYKPAPTQTVTMFDGRDACGFDGWLNDDIGVPEREDERPYFMVTHLEPYTQYAFYVKTVQLASAQTGGESGIKYFTTLPDEPMMVRNLRVMMSESDSITLAWDPPLKANGNLTKYQVKMEIVLPDVEDSLNKRNYCTQKWDESLNNPVTPPPEKVPEKTSPTDSHCDCQKENKLPTEEQTTEKIDFEDAVHNYVYVKRVDSDFIDMESKRRRRSIDNLVVLEGTRNATHVEVKHNKTVVAELPVNVKDKFGRYEMFYEEVAAENTTLRIYPLKHFTLFKITVTACREGPGKNCSQPAMISHRTELKPGADEIRDFKIQGNPKNNSNNVLTLTWTPPEEPNGLVLTYTIRYTKKDLENGVGQLMCIRASEYRDNKNEYRLKLPAENGNYSVEVLVTALAGPGEYSEAVYYRVEVPNYTWWIVLGVLSLIGILVGLLAYYYFQTKKREKDHRLFAEVNPDYDATPYIPDEYEIPRERVKRNQELGQGSFGMVYAGAVQLKEDDPTETPCAIKTVNDSATERERMDFLKEAHVMKEFHTPHVVQLLGVVSKGNPPLVVMELMAMGDLKGYLRAHRPDADPGRDGETPVPPSVRQILQMAIEIADGMAYLSYKKFVHRDLAARNCMVAGDMTVKIGDFGMTRDIYETDYYRKGDKGLLPVRWMSPESLKDGIFTTSNDVFSYGVVLWEMATLASQPYQGLSNDQVLRYVIDGGVMERPENCPEKIYQLMRRCWQHRPSSRPTFLDIVALLLEDVNAEFYRSSFYFSEEGEAHRYMLQNDGHHPDEGTTLLRPENEMSHENQRENWDMPNNNNNSRRLLEGGAMPIIKPAQSPLRFLTGKSGGNDYKESKF